MSSSLYSLFHVWVVNMTKYTHQLIIWEYVSVRDKNMRDENMADILVEVEQMGG